MRVISGFFKGKKILEPKDLQTRPLKDLTKESIFNIIKHSNKFKINLDKAIILDLFSGVGSFGIECLSLGVKKVVFVENYNKVLPILKKNLANLKSNINFDIIEKDIINSNLFSKFNEKYDLVFLDPPYKEKDIDTLLIKIDEGKILNKNSIIIIHRHKSKIDTLPSNFKIIEEKTYGVSKILFLNQ
jgi:16S rRNA (guanine966-N2)-methyltransferase